ncbi:bifunctional hydroxymethylpyrimidine kinase/phosphomethylpyrimidine kinase [Microbacterium resistens]
MSGLDPRDLALYLVTDAALSGPRGVAHVVAAAVDGGVRIVQLREKHAPDAAVAAQLVELSDVIGGRALLLVDDRIDAAVEARRRGARVDGVHLGQSDASVLRAREMLGPDAVIGLTANTRAHLDGVRALPEGTVDYLGVGVIRPTATKPDHPPALGVDGFAALAAEGPVPCVAIGGITAEDVPALRAAGAAGVAVVSALCAAPDPREAARELRRRWRRPGPARVLSIAGSDPSGGAGIQADLKSIAAHGGYGMAAITALTAQNTRGVRGVHVPDPVFLRAQLDAIADDIEIDAVKIGMLATSEVIETVGDWLAQSRPPAVVVDPVMVATSGDRLLDARAERALTELLRRADLITPNLAELAVLTGEPTAPTWTEALAQAGRLSATLGVAVLVKGGHLPGADAPDALVRGSDVREFPGHRIETTATHGTGCSLSAGIATRRARGEDWPEAVRRTRQWLRDALRGGEALGVGAGHGPVDHFVGQHPAADASGAAPDAREIEAEWWAAIAPVRAAIDDLPFIRGLAEGTLSDADFRSYLAQDALYLRDYARVLAAASRSAPSSTEQSFWAEAARGAIEGELELHAQWLMPGADKGPGPEGGEGAGKRETVFSAAPGPITTAYLDHLRAVAFDAEHAVLIAALLPCFWLYTDLGVRLQSGELGAQAQDPGHPYASWLATYADPAFAEATRTAIDIVTGAAASAGARTRRRMRAAFVRSAELEHAFFAAPLAAGERERERVGA